MPFTRRNVSVCSRASCGISCIENYCPIPYTKCHYLLRLKVCLAIHCHSSISHHLQVHIRNLHTELYNTGFRITFLWIPSHCGIQGNELADLYAKQSLCLDTITDIPYNFESIKIAIQRKVFSYWQAQWLAEASMTQLRTI